MHTHVHVHTHTHTVADHAYLAISPSTACWLTGGEAEKGAGKASRGAPFSLEATAHLSEVQMSPRVCVGRPHPSAHGNQEGRDV